MPLTDHQIRSSETSLRRQTVRATEAAQLSKFLHPWESGKCLACLQLQYSTEGEQAWETRALEDEDDELSLS